MPRTKNTARIVRTDANAPVEDPEVGVYMDSQEEESVPEVRLHLTDIFVSEVSI